MATLDVPPQRGARIELAVQREMARRRRLMRLYLLLLLIPLGVAGWFVAAGRSDRQIVRQEVREQVAPVAQRYAEIAPKLEQVKGLGELLPAVQSAALAVEAQKTQVSALVKSQETLRQQVTAVSSNVQELVPQVRALSAQPESRGLQRELGARVDELTKSVKDLRLSQDGVLLQQRRIFADLEKIRVERQPSPGAGAPDLSKLELRLQQLEQDNQALRGEVRKMRAVRPPG